MSGKPASLCQTAPWLVCRSVCIVNSSSILLMRV
jgi:hypothetical protein